MTTTKTTMAMPTTALLDGDMVAHRTAYIAEDIDDMPMLLAVTIKSWTPPGCTVAYVAISDTRNNNYRRSAYAKYKVNRDNKVIDEELSERLAYAKELLGEDSTYRKFVPTLEADDLMGIAASAGQAVAVTLDKDLLSVPGWHYRPVYSHLGKQDENGKQHKVTHEAELIYQPEWRADEMFYTQWLTGDVTDGYKGLYRFGPKAALKLLRENRRANWDACVLAEYEKRDYDYEYCIAMARCARILRVGEWTKETGIKLYESPCTAPTE